ncbi:MAG TPA: cob(I)yrinic acid a,c-diamide adenosyltransferase [Acidimicrobiales bacterium]|nr:cob(I)yrinic acid a,c-diamide adenosyltransferase [Acidimicrobiales bacterium]
MRVYTRRGDDGTTGLYFGGRLPKDAAVVDAYGTVDEAQAFLGLARSETAPGSPVDRLLVELERDLWVLMADLATDQANRHKLEDERTQVTASMVSALERRIDELSAGFEMPTEFVIPGQGRLPALLDVARTVVRRAERQSLAVAAEGSHVVPFLNRLSDLLWTLARSQESESLNARPTAQDKDAP